MSHLEGARLDEALAVLLHLGDEVKKALVEADSFKGECHDLMQKVDKLSNFLQKAHSVGHGNLYGRPTRKIMVEVEKTLEKVFTLAKKCKRSGMLKRVITITSAADFKRLNILVDNAIEDVTWLLNVSAVGDDRPDSVGLPPIAINDPVLATIWEQIAVVQVGSMEARSDSASILASYGKESERNCKLIIEEGGLPPLLRLLKEGSIPGQEAAAEALGILARDGEKVKQILDERAVEAFIHILTHGSMKVQVKVARALAQMVSQSGDAQDEFAAAGAIRLLVSLLAYDTLDDTSKNPKTNVNSIHTIVKDQLDQKTKTGTSVHKPVDEDASSDTEKTTRMSKPADPPHSPDPKDMTLKKPYQASGLGPTKPPSGGVSSKPVGPLRNSSFERSPDPHSRHGHNYRAHRQERDREDPETKQSLKAEAAHALWKLAAGNVKNSKSITDTRALLCFAKLIESGEGLVQYNSVMAVTEIAKAAEQDAELRRAAFKTNSPAAKAVVEQLLKVIESGEAELQAPCIKAIGCLARIFPAPALHVLKPLTYQIQSPDGSVAEEACIALQKFAYKDNYLHLEHSRTILDHGGASHLVQLVYFEQQAQREALILLSHLALNVGDSEALAKAGSLAALEAASRWPSLSEDVRGLLCDAIEYLELFRAGPRAHTELGFCSWMNVLLPPNFMPTTYYRREFRVVPCCLKEFIFDYLWVLRGANIRSCKFKLRSGGTETGEVVVNRTVHYGAHYATTTILSLTTAFCNAALAFLLRRTAQRA
ncbi:hypothetical protein R1flu_011614 [Riccia fluitans]|uniref:DUF7792 domain-containing protein n=1 Tax=Riccia fluitans TaxID=41844 RepID=A0ABD1ZCH4_9MARC